MHKALFLKYRPLSFDDVIGQDSVSKTLSRALSLNKVSHAYLFSGLRGSGKTSSARIFARGLQCEQFPTSSPCNECDSCKSALRGSHMDIIEMDAASSRGIDEIKKLIEHIQYTPAQGRFKIFIIDEIHMLTKEAFNALLKTLEEPPEYVKFILATTDPLKLPPTITSRTQHFRFKKVPPKIIATHLKRILDLENVEFEESAIDLIARNCGGSLRDAITELEQAIMHSKGNVTLGNVSSMLGALNPSVIEEFFHAIVAKNDKKVDELVEEFETYECENVIDEMMHFLKNQILDKAHNQSFSVVILDRFFKILIEAKTMIGLSADSSFVILLIAMKFQEALKIQEIDKVIAKLEEEVADSATNAPMMDSAAPPLAPKNPFAMLIDKVYDVNYNLGEVFQNNISFVSYENDVLTWQSRAQGDDKKLLSDSYVVIKRLAKEVYGTNLTIKATSAQNADSPNIDSSAPFGINKDSSAESSQKINSVESAINADSIVQDSTSNSKSAALQDFTNNTTAQDSANDNLMQDSASASVAPQDSTTLTQNAAISSDATQDSAHAKHVGDMENTPEIIKSIEEIFSISKTIKTPLA